tara:strand:- start:8 stop:283 length:276 start_codon:yes stop_codon:yes gene_type:complete
MNPVDNDVASPFTGGSNPEIALKAGVALSIQRNCLGLKFLKPKSPTAKRMQVLMLATKLKQGHEKWQHRPSSRKRAFGRYCDFHGHESGLE